MTNDLLMERFTKIWVLWFSDKIGMLCENCHIDAVYMTERCHHAYYMTTHYRYYNKFSFFVNEKFCILIKISLKFVPKGPIDHNPTLV